ncbi:putative 2'-deoxymugineic-acid 2'-dioxygenase [Helianthus anomalus]
MNKPIFYFCREVLLEYSKRTREVTKELLSGISTGLGLDHSYVERALKLDSGFQILAANLYPPCPQPELAIGLPPPLDHGLLTLLINNGVTGLQIKHKGKWFNVNNDIPNSSNIFTPRAGSLLFLVMESIRVWSTAMVNNAVTRLSVVVANGPSLDAVVEPAYKLVTEEKCPPTYIPMKYMECLEMQQGNQIGGKSCLDKIRA